MKKWFVGQRVQVRPKFPLGNTTVYKGKILEINQYTQAARVEWRYEARVYNHWFTFEHLERMQEESNG